MGRAPKTQARKFLAVDPLPGLLPWLGGKRNLAQRLVARIEAIPHTCYAEPFIGMGGVFFRRRQRPAVEAINDRSGEVANLFRLVQRHPEALLAELAWRIASREEFDRLKAMPAAGLTDIERAARFLSLQTMAFGGKVTGQNWGYAPSGNTRTFSPRRLRLKLRAAHRRLDQVYVDNLDYADFIARWDRPGTLFFLDPPYFDCESDYGAGLFERADFERLSALLRRLKGTFILTLNEHPEVRRLFRWARVEAEQLSYSVGKGAPAVNLVISSPSRAAASHA